MKIKRRISKGLATSVVLALVGAVALPACSQQSSESAPAQQDLYQCPMHPNVTDHEPDDCPICGMRLVPVESGPSASTDQDEPTAAEGREILYWVAPMDPDYRSDEPGKSPMGMDLVPVYADEAVTGSTVKDRVTVEIDPVRVQQLGVRVTEATKQVTAVRTIRTVGFATTDEERIVHVHSKIDGWIEHVRVQTLGDPVKKGQVLYELYSPELVATQEELLSAVRAGNRAAAQAARERLAYWDVARADIRAIEQGGEVWRTIPFRSPTSGFIHELKAVAGMRARAMTDLYVLMNLERIWVVGKFYETQLDLLQPGIEASVHLPNGDRIVGSATYVYPTIDEKTRHASVRFSFANDDLRLRPGLYVTLDVRVDVGTGIVLPRDAVLRTGSRALAFVAKGGGRFEPRELELGPETDNGYLIRSGVDAGERVAHQATFFIDSESSLKAALSKFSGGGAASEHNH